MMKKIKFLISIIVIMLLFIGCTNQNKSESENNLDYFWDMVDNIKENFQFNDYQEIMQDKSHILALPMEYATVAEAEDFLTTQKLFVYTRNQGCIILLQMTCSEISHNEWQSSINYNSNLFNSENSKYGDLYDKNIPDVEIAINSFAYEGINYQIFSIAQDNEDKIAATELMDFSNELISFIKVE